MNKKQLYFFLSFLLLFMVSHGDEYVWSLKQCEEYALTHSPLLNSSELESKKAFMDEITAFSSALPQVSLSGYRVHNLMIAEMPMKMPGTDQQIKIKMGRDYNVGGSVKISQNLFAGGSIYRNWKINRYQKYASEQDYEFQENQLIFIVRALFYQICFLDKQLKALNESKDRALENLKIVETLFQSGGASEFEKLRAQVDYRNTLPLLSGTEDQLKIAYLQFKKLIGLGLNSELQFPDSFSAVQPQLDLSDLDNLKAMALETRNDLKKITSK